jgi:hypothetical protein
VKPHPFDLLALIFGLAVAMVGAGFLINEATGVTFNGAWAAAIGLIALGVVALLATLLRRPHPVELATEQPDEQ